MGGGVAGSFSPLQYIWKTGREANRTEYLKVPTWALPFIHTWSLGDILSQTDITMQTRAPWGYHTVLAKSDFLYLFKTKKDMGKTWDIIELHEWKFHMLQPHAHPRLPWGPLLMLTARLPLLSSKQLRVHHAAEPGQPWPSCELLSPSVGLSPCSLGRAVEALTRG